MNKVFVVGLGYVGLPLAIEASKNGYEVTGVDSNEAKIERLKKGICDVPGINSQDLLKLQANSTIFFTNLLPKIDCSAIYIIAVPTPVDQSQNPDLSFIKNACISISEVITSNSLVINESTSFIGTLKDLIIPIVAKSGATNLKFAVAPERIDPANPEWNLKNTPRVIGGIDDESLKIASKFYRKFCTDIVEVSSPEIAEAAKLLENSFRQVNIALINELTSLTSLLNLSMHEIISAAATKPFGFMKFNPSIGVGGHCIPVDPNYLLYSSRKYNVDLKLIDHSNNVNLNMPEVIVKRIENFLNYSLKNLRIQIAGIAYKSNVADTRESPAIKIMEILRGRGAIVSWCDPLVLNYNSEESSPLSAQIDLGLIVTPHSNIDFTIWSISGTKVLDLSSESKNYGWPKFI